MRIQVLRPILSLCLGIAVVYSGVAALSGAEIDGEIGFNRDVRPILADRCFACHGPDAAARKADLRLDERESAVGAAIVPGNSQASEILRRVAAEGPTERMPPPEAHKPPLTPREVDVLRRWIDSGAKYEPHWSLVPLSRPAVPVVRNEVWCRGEVDRFVLARLEAEQIAPSSEADRATLIRRLSFDLTGLPPSAEEVEAFLQDERADAYERLVDRLLASPHYGERMAMYWLDLVRYADTVGYHGDQEHAISPYRDWVIWAFNENMPFDQFTLEQLAGDLLPGATVNQKIASGYNRVLQTSHEGGVQQKEYQAKYDADRVRNVSTVWMGATLGCAECHDHKYDPYTQEDFYRFVAFFADVDDSRTFQGRDTSPTRREPEMLVHSPLDSPGDKKRRTMVTEAVEPRTIRVLPRGDWMDESGPIVEPGVPKFVKALGVEGRRPTRVDLARWLTSPDHPQTARVFVNRLWYLFFGSGLSNTLDDCGSQGEWPTHPELLDWLAVEFVAPASGYPGWDAKHLVRLIVTSATYRQSSQVRPELRGIDPGNRLYARQSRFRLPAEMIRDQALAVSGLLVRELGGSPARPYQPAGYYAHLNFPERGYQADEDENQYRRGVYMHWQRQFLHPMLKAFDAPSREECTAERPRSNTPQAALTLLNDPTFVEAARVFAERIVREGGDSVEEKAGWAWREVLSREPSEKERELLVRLYRDEHEHFAADLAAAAELAEVGLAPTSDEAPDVALAAWTSVARALLNLNEAISRN